LKLLKCWPLSSTTAPKFNKKIVHIDFGFQCMDSTVLIPVSLLPFLNGKTALNLGILQRQAPSHSPEDHQKTWR
jgi:hypothetical protein